MNKGKRVFKKNSAPKKRRTKESEGVLLIKDWQKDIIRVFNSLERRFKRMRHSLVYKN